MDDRSARALGWLVMHAVFFPVLIAVLRVWHAANGVLAAAGLVPPPWLRNVITFLLFAVPYIGLAYLTAYVLNRRYPNTPVESAAWEDVPGFRRNGHLPSPPSRD